MSQRSSGRASASVDSTDVAELRRQARREQRHVRRSEGRLRRRTRRSFLWRRRRALYVVAVVLLATTTGAGAVLSRIPLPQTDTPPQTSYLCAADVPKGCGPDNALTSFSAEQDRQLVRYDQIPRVLIDAVVAAEDRTFFTHSGVDPSGVLRALWHDLRGEGSLQGGSTITQQYVKNAYLTRERTFTRKVREAVLAVKLERALSKEQILERYLNAIYFGRSAYGVAAASRAYFGHDLSHMDLQEAAYLAGLIRSPETADVYYADARDEARFRMRVVLDAMVQQRFVTPAQAAQAVAVPFERFVIGRQDRKGLGEVAHAADCGTPYFVDYVRQTLLADPRIGAGLYTKGLRIYTTLDLDKQCKAFKTLYLDTLTDPANDPSAALVSVDQLGRVVALVGGRDYSTLQVNLALGRQGGGSGRQPGSAFKPFTLAAAIQAGVSPQSRFPAPSKIVIPGADNGNDWSVSNYADGGATSSLTLLDATKESSNTVYAQLISKVGADKVASLARQMGVTADLAPVPALVLGTAEVSVLDMASAYSTFANRGWHSSPQAVVRVEDADGHTLWEPSPDTHQVLREGEADQVTSALRRVVQDGTGKRAHIRLDAAGKTGTTENAHDAWFVGYTCNLTTAVWMGFAGQADKAVQPMRGILGVKEITGGSVPATMWSQYMDAATDGVQQCDLTPAGVRYTGTVLNAELGTTTTSTASTSTTTGPSPTSLTSTTQAASPAGPQVTVPETTVPLLPTTTIDPSTGGGAASPQTGGAASAQSGGAAGAQTARTAGPSG